MRWNAVKWIKGEVSDRMEAYSPDEAIEVVIEFLEQGGNCYDDELPPAKIKSALKAARKLKAVIEDRESVYSKDCWKEFLANVAKDERLANWDK